MSAVTEEVLYEDLENTDFVTVELVPERKGLILKHCEYYVSSRRHGTTVTRRYNEFVQLYDVLFAKYPYRAVCRLPPKRVVVGGGSERFLRRRRAALQRWLTLVARHPVLAHDADTRAFLCESSARLERPRHDEFTLAGARPHSGELTTDEMQAAFVLEQEQLRLVYLGLVRLSQIFERVEARRRAERADVRELGAALAALGTRSPGDGARWPPVRDAMRRAASLASCAGHSAEEADGGETGAEGETDAEEEGARSEQWHVLQVTLEALGAFRELCARLSRGLHAERAAAAAAAPATVAAQLLRDRHWYALRCALQECSVARAYSLCALAALPSLWGVQARAAARAHDLWDTLHSSLRQH